MVGVEGFFLCVAVERHIFPFRAFKQFKVFSLRATVAVVSPIAFPHSHWHIRPRFDSIWPIVKSLATGHQQKPTLTVHGWAKRKQRWQRHLASINTSPAICYLSTPSECPTNKNKCRIVNETSHSRYLSTIHSLALTHTHSKFSPCPKELT